MKKPTAAATVFREILVLLLAMAGSAYGQIFVTNSGAGTVGEYNLDGTTINSSLISGLNNPVSIAVSGSILYVVSQLSNSSIVGVYTTSGATINASLLTIPYGNNQGGVGFALSGSNLLFAVGTFGIVAEYTTSGTLVNAALIKGLALQNAIAVSGSNIFVYVPQPPGQGNPSYGNIAEYTTSGTLVNAALISNAPGPTSMTVSGSTLYELATSEIVAFPITSPTSYTPNGPYPIVNNQLGGYSQQIAALGQDLFVTANLTYAGGYGFGVPNSVGEYSAGGAVINSSLIGGPASLQNNLLNRPWGIAVTSPPTASPATGTYFGSFGGNTGTWSLIVNRDGTGTYIAYLNNPQSAIVTNVVVASNGSFATTGSTVTPQSIGDEPTDRGRSPSAAVAYNLSGSIASGAVTGSLTGVNGTFSGTQDSPTGATAATSGLYVASNSAGTSTTYIVAGSAGRVGMVTIGQTLVDGGLGTVSSGGTFNIPTQAGTTVAGTVTTSGTVTGTITAAGSSAVPISGAVVTTLTPPTRLINLSILTSLATPGDSVTLGYVVGGAGTSGTKQVLMRAAGPSIAAYVPNPLANPQLALYAGSTEVTSNAGWGGTSALVAAFAQAGAFSFTSPTSKDSALVSSIGSGDNSIIVSATDSGVGSVLAEIYDLTPANTFSSSTPRLINVSVLKQLNSGFTLGFVVAGTTTETVLIRAVGPGLATAGITSGTVANPTLTLFSGPTQIDSNSGWGGTAVLTAAISAAGAFAIPATSKDAALLETLQPGPYTVQVSGAAGNSGLVIAEVYEVP